LPVQPHLQKYSVSGLTQITSISLAVPPTEGRIARRHERGTGCGGRESVRRAMAIAGRDEPRERCAARETIGALADGKAVWFWHPLLVLNSRRQVGPTGRRQSLNPRMTVTRRIRRRGEHGISRKTIARGMPGDFRCDRGDYARVLHLTSHARLRVQRAPGIPCALCFRGRLSCKARAHRAAGSRTCV
jgi:hypothetical protein